MSKDQGTSYLNISTTGLIYTGATQVYAITLRGGSNASVLVIKDALDDVSGTILWELAANSNTSETVTFQEPLRVKKGLYVSTLSGTGAKGNIALDGMFTTTSTSTSTSTTTS